MLIWIVLFLLPVVLCLGLVRVRTGSRIHFGLLSLPDAATSRGRSGESSPPPRQFGGVGMMVHSPGIDLSVEEASAWSAEGPLSGRALQFARQFVDAVPHEKIPPQRILIDACAPEHVGLGTGTQLGLAVAGAVSRNAGLRDYSAIELARFTGRGVRSALGIHGFSHGGFLVEAGKRRAEEISPLVANLLIPESWRIILILPNAGAGLHGDREIEAFRRLLDSPSATSRTDALCRLVLLEMLPALAGGDLNAFGNAVYEFNLHVGSMFAPAQGGSYSDPSIAEIISFLRKNGIKGTGQSSWGPTVFALVQDQERANYLAGQVSERFGLSPGDVLVTTPLNTGAATNTDPNANESGS